MLVEEILKNNRNTIIGQWEQAILSEYQSETAKFLSSNKDKFANPVGFSIYEALPAIFDYFSGEGNITDNYEKLSELIKIRAIQDFTPSQAIGFIFTFREILINYLSTSQENNVSLDEIEGVNKKAQYLVMHAYDIYILHKSRMLQIQADEIKNRYGKIIERYNEEYSNFNSVQ